MKIHSLNTESSFNNSNLCLAIGNFDGLHKGHLKIINKLKETSLKNNLHSAVMSFNPHPRIFFNQIVDPFNIYTHEDKLKFLKDLGLDLFIEFSFNNNLSKLSADEFIIEILINKLQIKYLVIGTDFKFGKDRKGDFKTLNKYVLKKNFKIHLINPVMLNDKTDKHSSSIIRTHISNGNMEEVRNVLGRPWHMRGIVIEGDRRARQINFPTANIIPAKHILPKKGVYCVEVVFEDKKYKGVANFGLRPTVNGNNLLLETHMFNFNKEIYGKELTVEFLTFIRTEQKFNNFEELTEQINKDINKAKEYHQI